jgi:hypothetical protein
MRTAVVEREELAAQVEYDDGAAVHLRKPAGAGRNVTDGGDHMLGHGQSALSSRDESAYRNALWISSVVAFSAENRNSTFPENAPAGHQSIR